MVRLRAEVAQLRSAGASGDDLIDLDNERVLQEVGIYNYHHPLENAEAFKERLGRLQERLKEMVLQNPASAVGGQTLSLFWGCEQGERIDSVCARVCPRG